MNAGAHEFILLVIISSILLKNGAMGQDDPPRPISGVRLYLNVTELDDFSKVSIVSLNSINGLWCQTSANDTGLIGTWYTPDGIVIEENSTTALSVLRLNGQIRLIDTPVSQFQDSDQGLYTCVIPNENNVNETLVVAVYTNENFNLAAAPILTAPDFELLSTTRDADPPIFAINFIANRRPPTEIDCYLNNNTLLNTTLYNFSKIINSSLDPVSVNVTITFTTRQAGNYTCEVTTNKYDFQNLQYKPATDPINVAVPSTPVNVTSTITGFETVNITWSTSTPELPSPDGYEVFYKVIGSETTMSMNLPRNLFATNIFVPNLITQNYSIFVVAYFDSVISLPSSASDTSVIPQIISLDVSGPSSTLPYLSNATLYCEAATVAMGVEITSLEWIDPFGNEISNYTGDDESFVIDYIINDDNTSGSLDLEIRNVLLSEAGIYTCCVTITTVNDGTKANTTHPISVQVAKPSVSVSTNAITNGRIFDTGQVLFVCSVTVFGIDSNFISDVTSSWYGPDGAVENSTDSIIGVLASSDNGTADITLLINNLNITSDNNTIYNCSINFGASMNFISYEYIVPNSAADSSSPLVIDEFPDIDVMITLVGDPIISEDIQLLCNATISDKEFLDNVTLEWLYNGAQDLPENVTLTEQDDGYIALTINPVHRIHNGNYTCYGQLMLNGVQAISTSFDTMDLVAIGNPSINITDTGSAIANSSNYSLICTVTVDDGVPNIFWLYSNDSTIVNNTETFLVLNVDEQVSILELQFATLDYSSAGDYTCVANLVLDIGEFNSSELLVVTVEVPSPVVTVELNNSMDNTYEATRQTLICTVIPTNPLPDPSFIDIQWTVDDEPLVTDGFRLVVSTIDEYVSMLTFSPVSVFDSMEYKCTAMISTHIQDVINTTESSTFNLTIQELPKPTIVFNSSSVLPFVGNMLTLTCYIDTIDDLYNVTVSSSIIRNSNDVKSNESQGDAIVELTFNPLMATDVGDYSCLTILMQQEINLNLTFSGVFNVSGNIPEPDITLSTNPIRSNDLLEGTLFTISCTTVIDESLNSEYNVMFNWVLNNNEQNLLNYSKYSILPIMSLNNTFNNTLQINELEISDNNSTYTCMINTVSNNVFLNDSTSSKSVSLKVTEFTSDDLSVTVTKSQTLSLAGDSITLNCSVTVPFGFVSQPSNIIFAYDMAGNIPIISNHTDAAQSNITSNNDTIYSSSLTIASLNTSDAKLYYCIAEFEMFGTMAVGNVSVSIKIPTPIINVTISPNSTIYESTRVNVTCSATLSNLVDTDINPLFSWINPLGNLIEIDSRINIATIEILNNVYQSVLEFNPVDNGDKGLYNDSGSYLCQVILTSNNDLLLMASQNETFEIFVEDLFQVTPVITYSGDVVIGTNASLQCNVNVIIGLELVGSVSLTWDKVMGPDNDPIITNNDSSTSNITFFSLGYDERGIYSCIFSFNSSITNDIISSNEKYNLTVELPPLIIDPVQNQLSDIYAGTVIQLNCMILLSELINASSINVNSNWLRNGTINVVNNRILNNETMFGLLNYSANLFFLPISTNDNGNYQCNIVVSGDEYVTPSSMNSSDIELTVKALPNPNVSITTVEGINLGSPYTLICSVSVIEGLFVLPDITWMKQSVNTSLIEDSANEIPENLITKNETHSTIYIPSLNTSDSGNYTCRSEIKIDEINVVTSSTSSEIVQVKIISPVVSAEYSWGTNDLFITCQINVSVFVDTEIQIDVGWTNVGGIMFANDSRTTISQTYPAENSENSYRSDFRLTSPNNNDTISYTCSATIQPLDGYLYIDASDMMNSPVSVDIQAPSGPPADYSIVDRTPFSLKFQWNLPISPNGPIINYTLIVDYNNGTNNITLSFDYSSLSYTLNGLMPYQLINATISASTIGGPGPQSQLSNRTLQDTPGPVSNLSINVTDSSTVIVMWSNVLEPNGVILQYMIIISVYEGINIATVIRNGTEFNAIIDILEKETPYRVVVFAVNGAEDSSGVPSDNIFFTVEGAPPPPNDIVTSRINGTHINVTWTPIPLTEAKGFIQNYTVTYQRQGSLKRQIQTKDVSADESSTLIGGLDPIAVYNVQVAASTNAGMGEFSDSIISEMLNMQRFQVRAGPFDNCTIINSSYDGMIKTAIRSILVEEIVEKCTCNFTSSYINEEELTCITDNSNQLVYRANITQYNDFYTTTRLISIIEGYISTNPTVTGQSVSFAFNSSCEILFDSGEDVCGVTEGTTGTVEEADSLLFIIIGAVLGVVVALIVVLIVIIVTCIIRRNKKVKREQNIELTGYTEVVRQGDVENSTALNRQQDSSNPVEENLYSELSTQNSAASKRQSGLLALHNPLYADTDVVVNPQTIEAPLYADLTDVQEETAHVISNELYSLYREEDNGHVLNNELYSMSKGCDDETELVLENVLYGEVDSNGKGYEYAVVNKQKKNTSYDAVIENPGFEGAAVQKKSVPPPLDLDHDIPSKQSDDQYEAPWSAKHRSLKRQSRTQMEYDDIAVKSKEKQVSVSVDDQYETPWRAKHLSLSRKSATFDAGHNEKMCITTPPLYDDTVIRKKEVEDQYESPWSNKYRSLSRKSGIFEENDKPNSSNLYDDTVNLKKGTETLEDKPLIPQKPSTPIGIPEPSDNTYEMPWRNKIGSLKRNSIDYSPQTTGIPSVPNYPKSDKKSDNDTTGDRNEYEGDYAQCEYETINPFSIVSEYDRFTSQQNKSNGNVSSNNEPKSFPNEDSRTHGKRLSSDSRVPVLPLPNRQRIKSVPNRAALLTSRTPTIPESNDQGEYSTPFGSLDTGNGGVWDNKISPSLAVPDGDIYSTPFDHTDNGQGLRSNTLSKDDKPVLNNDDKIRHQSESEIDLKKQRKGLFQALKLKKTKPKTNLPEGEKIQSNAAATTVEDIYDTIDILPRPSPQQDNYANPVDAIQQKKSSSTPIPPALPPSRLSVAEKSKDAFLKGQKKNEELPTMAVSSGQETYSDPLDTIKNDRSQLKSSADNRDHEIASEEVNNVPLPYETPIQLISSKHSSLENLCSSESLSKENLSVPKQSCEPIEPYNVITFATPNSRQNSVTTPPGPYEIPIGGTSTLTSQDDSKHLYEETLVINNNELDDLKPPTAPQPYEIPIGDTSTSVSLTSPGIQDDSKHLYEEMLVTKNNELEDLKPPTVPQPYEIPIGDTSTSVSLTSPDIQDDSKHLYEETLVTKNNELEDLQPPTAPQPYEIPVNSKPTLKIKDEMPQQEQEIYEIPIHNDDEQNSNIVTKNSIERPRDESEGNYS